MPVHDRRTYGRRSVLRAGLGAASAAAAASPLGPAARAGARVAATAPRPRRAALPILPVGQATGAFPSTTSCW